MDYQWLKNYRENEEKLTYLKWALDKTQSMLSRWGKEEFPIIRQVNDYSAVSLKKKIQSIKQEIIELEMQLEDANDIFSSLDETDSQIMKLKYLDGLSLEDIAKRLGYSHSYIRKRHADLKRILVFLDSYQAKRRERTQNINL